MNALFGDEIVSAGKNTNNEWYTPAKYIEAARRVMGSIDLDPASSMLANQRVQAKVFYTKEDNGLAQNWFENVWCNPPYTQEHPGHSSIRLWTRKAVQTYEEKHITAAILLVPSDTSTRWFEPLWNYLVCFPTKRIQFDIPGKKKEQPTFGTCFVYLGLDEEKFAEVFSQFGHVVKSVKAPANAQHTNLELWSEVEA